MKKLSGNKRFKQIGIISVALLLCVMVVAAALVMRSSYVVPVLMYHSLDSNDSATKLRVSPAGFAKQMEFLYKHKYNVVKLDKMISYMEKKEPVPPKTVIITIDDGYYNNYQWAYPVLKKYNFPATLFVIVSKIDKQGFLGWKELREMSDSGLITIGSHTISHSWLPSLNKVELEKELAGSKKILEEGLGRKVECLCYPLGAFDKKVEEAAKEAGYKLAVATSPGTWVPDNDIFAIKRVKISRSSNNPLVFWIKISGYYTWIKEHRDHR